MMVYRLSEPSDSKVHSQRTCSSRHAHLMHQVAPQPVLNSAKHQQLPVLLFDVPKSIDLSYLGALLFEVYSL
jgi:hypothetical protein